ncbi:MAG: hypothetical protein OXU77_12830 [Gammaproteobacteria bacterium]|nr:hypothetical protein [Gammaproteobacteria bacterium]MDE0442985.1 hypothetical protein [Gammaproteobacteria bacterium]
MVRLRGDTDERCGRAASAIRLCVLVGALVGATLHDADHAFDEGDVPCSVCLHADRLASAATAAPSIPATRLPDVTVDLRQVVVLVSVRIAKEHRPRAPPFVG